uniref:WD_REPEATS_REGION domain-containing protein n=1 Tax=Angiostrongylus cantonensis TaxID=6313 RepID=A0A0K0CXV1_ANGCA
MHFRFDEVFWHFSSAQLLDGNPLQSNCPHTAIDLRKSLRFAPISEMDFVSSDVTDRSKPFDFDVTHRDLIHQVHGGAVWRVVWAHPEFGQLLATCSYDRSVHIWEEIRNYPSGEDHKGGRWVRKAYLTDSRANVTDIGFAPRHLGLILATVSAQGIVRIYEAADVMDLSRWSLCHELQVLFEVFKVPLSST